jgi:hypothetical protein
MTMAVDHSWRNIAEDAVNDMFRLYVGDQLLAVIRQQISVGQFVTNITSARDRRTEVIEAMESIT